MPLLQPQKSFFIKEKSLFEYQSEDGKVRNNTDTQKTQGLDDTKQGLRCRARPSKQTHQRRHPVLLAKTVLMGTAIPTQSHRRLAPCETSRKHPNFPNM